MAKFFLIFRPFALLPFNQVNVRRGAAAFLRDLDRAFSGPQTHLDAPNRGRVAPRSKVHGLDGSNGVVGKRMRLGKLSDGRALHQLFHDLQLLDFSNH